MTQNLSLPFGKVSNIPTTQEAAGSFSRLLKPKNHPRLSLCVGT